MIRDFYLTHIPIQLNAVIGGGVFDIFKKSFVINLTRLPHR